jgi:hypothetical protein
LAAAVTVAVAAVKMSTPDALDAVRAAARAAAGAAASPLVADKAARTEEGFAVAVGSFASPLAAGSPPGGRTPSGATTPRAGEEEAGAPPPRPPRRAASSLSLALMAAAASSSAGAGGDAAAAAPAAGLRRLRIGDRTPSCTDLVQQAGAAQAGEAAAAVEGAC